MTRLITKTDRLAARYIPKCSTRVAMKNGAAVVYLYDIRSAARAAFGLVGYIGTAGRPTIHFSYRSAEARAAAVTRFFAGAQASVESKATSRAAKAAWTNPLKVGDILYTSWGYDQTNVEFFAVTRVSGRRTWVREIAADSEATGHMSGTCWPAMPIRFVGDETMHTAQPSGMNGVYVRISASRSAWPEQGRSHSFSSYA